MNGKVIFSILLSIVIFLNGIIPLTPSAIGETTSRARVQEPPQGDVVVGSFDLSRGEAGSFTESPLFDQARASLSENFPGVLFSSSPTLTSKYLATIDILIISSLADVDGTFITPLSSEEQVALYQFVVEGGFVITLLSQATNETANRSIGGPFGVECEGLAGTVRSVIQAPRSSPLTYGRFGTVSDFSQHAAGGMTTLGPAVSLATNPLGSSLAVTYPGTLGPDSGATVFVSSTHSFLDDDELAGGDFSTNEALFLNTIDFFIRKLRQRPIIVDFDTLPDATFVNPGMLITDQYAALGVTFSSDDPQAPGLVTLDAGQQAMSAPNGAQAGLAAEVEFTATFVDPATGEPGVTDFVALTAMGDPAGSRQQLIALDLDGQVVATKSVDFSRSQPIEVRAPRRIIHQVKLITSGPIDDFTFAQVTPEPVCIGFDQFPDETDVPSGTVITNDYQSLGVVFSSDDTLVSGMLALTAPQLAISPPNVAQAGSRLGFEMRARFVDPETMNPAVTDFVSITTNRDPSGGLQTFIAFDSAGNVVAATIVDFSQVGQTVELRTPEPVIHEVRLVTSDFIDDLCFTPLVTGGDVTPPTVTVTAPNGGETLIAGRTVTINWTSSDDEGVTSQDIGLSTFGGTNFPITIASDLPGDVQSFDWTVPASLSTAQAQIKVVARDAAGNVGSDTSDANFSILQQIQAISPSTATQASTVEATITGMELGGASSVDFGPGVSAEIIQEGAGATSLPLRITISDEATIGPRGFTITTPAGVAASGAVKFTVLTQQDFSLTAMPEMATVVQGDKTTYAITAEAIGEFTGLINLSVNDLPDGVSAEFDRPMIAPGGLAYLAVSTISDVPATITNFNVLGTAEIAGSPVTRQSRINLSVISAGVTTISGRVLTADDMPMPLPGVRVGLIVDKETGGVDPAITTTTDAAGNFVLQNVPEGDQTFLFDGSTARVEGKKYPSVEEAFHIDANQPNRLNFIVHLPAIDEENMMPVQNNAPMDQMLSTPMVPNLEVMIPAGTEIRAPDGSMVTEVSLTPVESDRSPGPLPEGMVVPMLFSIQPGRAVPSQPVPVFFPNFTETAPGTKVDLFTFDVTLGRFDKYGTGTVSADGLQIVPDTDPATGRPFGLRRFAWHFPAPPPPERTPRPSSPTVPLETGPSTPGTTGTNLGLPGNISFCSRPPGSQISQLDLGGGIFTLADAVLKLDGLIPISLAFSYNSSDKNPGPFGIGTAELNYDYQLRQQGNTLLLTIPNGGNHRFCPIQGQPGRFENITQPILRGAVINREAGEFNFTLRFRNGAIFRFERVVGFRDLAALSAIIDRNGNTVMLNRTSPGRGLFGLLAEVRALAGQTLTLTHDSEGRVTSVRDNIGREVRFSYDGEGRLATKTDPLSGVTRYAFDDQNRMLSIADPRGNVVVQNVYDQTERVIQQTVADGGVYRFIYTDVGGLTRKTTVIDPLGNSTEIRFNCFGHILSVTDALQQTTTLERAMVTNELLAITDPLGRRTGFSYDRFGNTIRITDAAGNETRFEYDETFNQPTKFTNALNESFTLEYDDRGNLVAFTDPLGKTTTTSYDDNGQPLTVTNPLGFTTTAEYDEAGNLAAVIDPLGNRTVLQYDAVSRLTALTDPLGRTKRRAYDALDRIIAITDPQSGKTQFTYDEAGNLLSVTDPLDQTTSFAYDARNRVTSMTDPLGNVATTRYNQNSLPTSVTDRRDLTSRLEYDPTLRLKRITYADGSTIERRYDAAGNLTRLVDSESGEIQLVRDALNHVVSEITERGVITYTYDAADRRQTATANDQQPVEYSYDPVGRLIRVRQAGQEVFIEYDDAGRQQRLTLPNGVQTEYTYDEAAQLIHLDYISETGVFDSRSYTYDKAGTRTSVQDGASSLPTTFMEATYNAANQLVSLDAATFSYDPNGNLKSLSESDGVTTYAWDARNRLVAIDGPEITARFFYDAMGRRVRKDVNDRSIEYLYDGTEIIQELEEGRVTAHYLRGLAVDEIFSRSDSTGTRYFLTDALGSTISLLDENGIVTTRYSYDPFGATSVSGEPNDNPFQFTGRERDASDLYFYRARYYSPRLGRFLSEDPIGFLGGFNLYAYAGNNPINFVDPLGLVQESTQQGPPPCEKPTSTLEGFKNILTSAAPGPVTIACLGLGTVIVIVDPTKVSALFLVVLLGICGVIGLVESAVGAAKGVEETSNINTVNQALECVNQRTDNPQSTRK